MKDIIKRAGRRLSPYIDQLSYYFDFFRWKRSDHQDAVNKQNQILLSLKYQELSQRGLRIPALTDLEFRSFSQHGEDGILLYIFSLIGSTNKCVVEVCAGDGVECNAANLIIYHGWQALLFDGNAEKVKFGRMFYKRHLNTLQNPPTLVQAWIDVESIDTLIRDHGVHGEIDLLSLDMDGIDYWVYKAINGIRPRVMAVEFNASLGPERSATVEYRPDFVAHGNYWGASLAAYVKLLRSKGYRLIGADSSGINAFFVSSGLAEEVLPEVSAKWCFEHTRAGQICERLHKQAATYPWVDV